ncbi:MAG: HipA N-terminal domain-containing protein [Candidatus Omnitrophica bacterium]|nr:HipA N-terminal domain-containing protein [Candidatus Omnitrophota bacterium]MDD5081037.1 HipA N-terminal domain-containing protein [Candidatus Omnitrophota bacterium]MDD5441017.1 HipA N-terminal domain-containing protein [Candidatus Omnitrophota bacterium]
MNYSDISAINVFLENFKTRIYVGELSFKDKQWQFCYADNYFRYGSAIQFGPELPLTERCFFSEKMFPSFLDRIPDKENPAYSEYCEYVGISPDEENLLILLAALGHKGPSSFILEPAFSYNKELKKIRELRMKIGLTVREFASVFSISGNTLKKIEKGEKISNDIFRRFLIYIKFPDVLNYELVANKKYIHSEKFNKIIEKFNITK